MTKDLGQQLTFEELLFELSSAFVAAAPTDVDAEIQRWLGRLVAFLGVDRSGIAQMSLDGLALHMTHSAAVEGIPPFPMIMLDSQLPWYVAQVRQNRMLKLERLPEGLPEEAEAEHAYVKASGFKSHLMLPFSVGGTIVGGLGFGCFRAYRTWPDGLVKRLQLVAEVFGNALARKRAWQQLTERLDFERLIADLVKAFVNAKADELDALIGAGLGRVVEHLGLDRGALVRFSADGGALGVAHWVGPFEQSARPLAAYPWYAEQLRQGRTIILGRLPDDLPVEALAEREQARQLGAQSHLAIALAAGDRIWGGIALTAIRHPHEWTPEEVQRLRLVGEIMMDALRRREVEDAARRQHDELAHVARVAALGELTAAIAHELNQPLAAIKTNAEAIQLFLAKGKPLENLDAILADIVGDATRAGDLIRRLRNLLRRRQLEKTPVDVNQAISDMKSILSVEAHRHGASLVLELAPTLPPVSGDRVQLQQVMLNLVRNAAEAMAGAADGGAVRVGTDATGSDRVTVHVEDTGPPIDDVAFQRLFTPFHSTKPEGLGMGLAISRSIVQAHGGHLWAERRPARGLAVRFALPARP